MQTKITIDVDITLGLPDLLQAALTQAQQGAAPTAELEMLTVLAALANRPFTLLPHLLTPIASALSAKLPEIVGDEAHIHQALSLSVLGEITTLSRARLDQCLTELGGHIAAEITNVQIALQETAIPCWLYTQEDGWRTYGLTDLGWRGAGGDAEEE